MSITVTLVRDDRVAAGRVTVTIPEDETIKQVADSAGVECPTFCALPETPPGSDRAAYTSGSCGLCNVELRLPSGETDSVCACRYRLTSAEDGAVITVHSERLDRSRDAIATLIALQHRASCLTCPLGAEQCELRAMLAGHDLRLDRFPRPDDQPVPPDESHPVLVVQPDNCVLCRRCEAICPVGAVQFVGRGHDTRVVIDPDRCVNCGQCTHVCPAAAIVEKPAIRQVQEALVDPNTFVTVQVAPAVRVAVGEAFGVAPGTNLIAKLYGALRLLGFDAVFDTDFAADLTIVEEATELVGRLDGHGALPMITSCCPGWIRYVEIFWPDLLPHLSSCKSPQQMLGAVTKNWWAQQVGVAPGAVVSVAVMPCTAKKFEAGREEMADDGRPHVDHVLTTRELIRMLKSAGLHLPDVPEGAPTPMLSESTGAGAIFGATGGVLEAALRTVHAIVTGTELADPEVRAVRGTAGVRSAAVDLAGRSIEVAVVHGLHNLPPLLQQIRDGSSPYTFVEVMACPGGCVGGGGQPHGFDMAVRRERAAGLFATDAALPVRRSHQNAEVAALRAALSDDERHRLLHTHYAHDTSQRPGRLGVAPDRD
ncbi:MAG TPA: [FeFe] hydrogenase, group A [Marmoricola sp.]|nr:[FeFe] hydrogenase, group A [Marmoricola sp.]